MFIFVSITDNEQRWLEAAKAGEREAFERLAHAYEGRIFNFALKMCGHVDDAQDIVQDTLFAAFNSIRTFRGEAKLSTWFFKVAMSACHRMRRKSKFQTGDNISIEEILPQLEAHSARDEMRDSQEDLIDQREKKILLDEAIRVIPLSYRLVLVLRDVQGFSTEEVSEILGLTRPVVKVRLHRARLLLKDKLQLSVKRRASGSAKTLPLTSDCKELLRLASQYVDGDLDQQLCLRIKRHLGYCDTCESLCRSLRENMAACRRGNRKMMPASARRQLHASFRRILP
jgi:RNA polymerase sigma-70 factor (ECF subfamily)